MRKFKTDTSEMTNQVLFGETFVVLNKEEKWSYIELVHDRYQGWISNKQYSPISFNIQNICVSDKKNCSIRINDIKQSLVLGSLIPESVSIKNSLNIDCNLKFCSIHNFKTPFISIAKKYLNAPYLWGGRTPLGIDCSGYTQMTYRFFDIQLPRDAYQQAEKGKKINSINNARLADLAFFGDKEKITHVGIILNNQKIIHASGKVRIDIVDKKGIFNKEIKKYTHKLTLIQRILK